MTKTDRIRELTQKHPHLTSGQIGDRVGCSDAYVRAVWQRMKGGGKSAADVAYNSKALAEFGITTHSLRRKERYVSDPEFRNKVRASNSKYRRARYWSDPEFRARVIAASARWRRENSKRVAAYQRYWRARNKAEREASHA